jgi:RNA polymerase sigma factor (TIGR02999 family)
LKRGGGGHKLSLDDALTLAADEPSTDLLALDEVLEKLAKDHPEKAHVVELRFFGGMTTDEAATVLGVTTRTVERYWEFARAWLYRELASTADGARSDS